MNDVQCDGDRCIGAVVIGRNEGERLRRCLESVRDQVQRVVYVDSGSTDGSVELAESLGVDVLRLTDGPFTAALGRKTGFEHLLAQLPEMRYVQFIDGDCILNASWIEAAQACLDEHPKAAAVCGRRREEFSQKTIYNALIDIDWDIPPGEVPYIGGDALVRVEPLLDVGGWDVALIAGEEPDLCFRMRRQGWTIRRLGREATLHDVAMTRFGQYWRRSVRSGHAYLEVGLRHRADVGRAWLRMSAGNVAYGVVLPVVVVLAAFWSWLVTIALLLLYVRLMWTMFQSCKIRGYPRELSLVYAGANTVCKTAGAIGVAGLLWGRIRGKESRLIEYKQSAAGAGSTIKAVVYTCADSGATLLAVIMRLIEPIFRLPRRFFHLAQLRAGIDGHAPATTQLAGKVRTTRRARVKLGPHCRLGRNVYLETKEQGSIELGAHVTVNSGCVIVSYANVRIGDHCLIGEYTSIRDANHGIATDQPMRMQDHVEAPIVIEDDVWIGRGAVILKGVRLGSGAVIGANSVVTHDVPPMAIVAGVPAKLLRQRTATDGTDTPSVIEPPSGQDNPRAQRADPGSLPRQKQV
jgi:acetyltransferase-like isoleucine patch superfamily enzyme/glycosyltransferase involved in cell wall biosynthesis